MLRGRPCDALEADDDDAGFSPSGDWLDLSGAWQPMRSNCQRRSCKMECRNRSSAVPFCFRELDIEYAAVQNEQLPFTLQQNLLPKET